nr:MAG TPA: hypothetical protein [Caudoviricetes sp.]
MRSGFPCYGGQNITVSHPSCKTIRRVSRKRKIRLQRACFFFS